MARRGLVRALSAFDSKKREATGRAWAQGGVAKEYRRLLIAGAAEQGEEGVPGVSAKEGRQSKRVVTRRGMKKEEAEKELARLRETGSTDLKIAKVIRCRVRYFTDGAVIGSRGFVDGIFQRTMPQQTSPRKWAFWTLLRAR